MRFDDVEKAKILIRNSNILSSVEKTEWLQLLPEMNDKQVLDLINILSQPVPKKEEPLFPPKLKPVDTTPQRKVMGVDLNEKEIGTSVPFYELEITAPHTEVTAPQAPKTPVPDPEILQKRVGEIVKELESKRSHKFTEPVAPPKPIPTPVAKEAPKPKTEDLILNGPEDFAKLTASYLHEDRNPHELMKQILDRVGQLAQENKFVSVLVNLEKSPLNQTYLNFGGDLLNDSNPDRDAAYTKLINESKQKGKDYLTKEEFEAITDFRSEINRLYL